MLFILDEADKIREPSDVDDVVKAEIPNPAEDPELYEIVKSCMIHGPCGHYNENSPCMAEEKGEKVCTKKFPKEFCETTNVNVDGYPKYRRPRNGYKITVRDYEVDNAWVVPYNPYLSRKYKAHINVEVCTSVKSVKYIFKYVYKGHDAAIVQMSTTDGTGTYNWDEISMFLDTRYVGPSEAMWRLSKYEMSHRSHAIERLPVHLPLQQTVIFEEGSEENILRAAERNGTKLTKWFELNCEDESAKQFLYCDIPYHFVWKKVQKVNKWVRRKARGDKILSRLYTVSPKDTERFALRLLLLHKPGN